MTNIKIVNFGNCTMCGKEIMIVTNKENNKFLRIDFCPKCYRRRRQEIKKNLEREG